MNAAAKSKRKQAGIARAEREVEDLVAINVRIPKEMHRKLGTTASRRARA